MSLIGDYQKQLEENYKKNINHLFFLLCREGFLSNIISVIWQEPTVDVTAGIDSEKTVFEKLNEARVRFQMANVKKSGNNKFAGYTYYELADILPQINAIAKDLKFSCMYAIAFSTMSC